MQKEKPQASLLCCLCNGKDRSYTYMWAHKKETRRPLRGAGDET